jgi:hypothetical protein
MSTLQGFFFLTAFGVMACGTTDSGAGTPGTGGSVQSSGGGPSVGGAGGVAGGVGASNGGTRAGTGGGNGGSTASSGGRPGSGGSAGTGGAVIQSPPSLGGIDLGLGGLNADLVPATDCLSKDQPTIGCVTLVGDFGGQRFDGCVQWNVSTSSGLGQRSIQCYIDQGGDRLEVVIVMSYALTAALPGPFHFSSPPDVDADTFVSVSRSRGGTGYFNTATSAGDGHHHLDMRMAGVAWVGPGYGNIRASMFARGAFALVATPTSTCASADGGYACDVIRVRGNFTARVQVSVP